MKTYRIMIVDQFSPVTHVFFDNKLISMLSQIKDIEKIMFVGRSELFNNISRIELSEKVTLINIDEIYVKKPKIYREYKKFMLINNLIKQFSATHLFFSSFENLTFSLFKNIFPQIPIVCFIHYNLDDLIYGRGASIKRLLFRLGKNRQYFVVFEDFLKEKFLNIFKFDPDFVCVIPHPIERHCGLFNDSQFSNLSSKKGEIKIFIPSGSSDQESIRKIIQQKDFKNKNIKIYSKYNKEVDLGWFVGKPYFSKKEYSELMRSSDLIYIPYFRNVGYRISGPILDSIYCRKHIITTQTPFTKYISEKYPYTIYLTGMHLSIYDIESIFKIRQEYNEEYEKSWRRFIEDHSDEKIKLKIESLLTKLDRM